VAGERKVRAAIYARFSTDRQSEASIADQVRVCTDYATRNGFKVAAQFEDQGISGASIAGRPGVRQLIDAALAGQFEAVLVTDLSRLSRAQIDLLSVIEEFEEAGIRLLGVQEGYDSSRMGAEYQASGSGMASQSFRRMIKERTGASLRRRAEQGYHTGGKVFGYATELVDPARLDGYKRLIVDEAEAATVRREFEQYAAGASPRTIAATLNARGVPSPGAKWKRTLRRTDAKWLASTVLTHLNNPLYTGLVVYGRRASRLLRKTGKRVYGQAADSAIERRDERLRIVSDALWAKVKDRQNLQAHQFGERVKGGLRRNKPGQGPRAKYLLSGLLKCGVCGAGFVLSGGDKAVGLKYQCASHINGGDAACSVKISLPRDRAERVIRECVEMDLLVPQRLTALEEILNALTPITVDYSAQIRKLEAQERNLMEAVKVGGDMPVLVAALKEAQEERARLEKAAGGVKSKARRTRPTEPAERRIARARAALAEGGEPARAMLRELFPDGIPLSPDVSKRYLWATLDCDIAPLLDVEERFRECGFGDLTVGDLESTDSKRLMVAGAGFEPATFGL
jgi:site-specific DNA recombinase